MNTDKKPRHYASELLEVMRIWLRDNVPQKFRTQTAQHVLSALFRGLPVDSDANKKPE